MEEKNSKNCLVNSVIFLVFLVKRPLKTPTPIFIDI